MADSDKNIVITPNKGSSTLDPTIVLTGADTGGNDPINLYTTFDGTISALSIEASAGQLLKIDNSMTGTIYSVNDVSGIPSIEVIDDGTIILGEFGGNVGVGTASPTKKLDVVGDVKFSGTLFPAVQSLTGNGAVSTTTLVTEVTSNANPNSLTLGNGTVGQMKIITYVAEGAGTDTVEIAPDTFTDPGTANTKIVLDTIGESVTLVYCTTIGWVVSSHNGATFST